jgi:hypothetical protein
MQHVLLLCDQRNLVQKLDDLQNPDDSENLQWVQVEVALQSDDVWDTSKEVKDEESPEILQRYHFQIDFPL